MEKKVGKARSTVKPDVRALLRPKGLRTTTASAAASGGENDTRRSKANIEVSGESVGKVAESRRKGKKPATSVKSSVSPVSKEKLDRRGSRDSTGSSTGSEGSKKKTSTTGDSKTQASRKVSVKTSVSPVSKEKHDRREGRKGSKDYRAGGEGSTKNTSITDDSKTSRSRKVSVQSTGAAKREPKTELGQQVQSVLHGAIDVKCPINTKTIRIFISSTFTDTVHERNALMERVYPKLKIFCQARGYEFQAVDMRWGVRDAATNMHMTAELCLREIKACQKLSVGPNFVMLLSQKYGYCPLLPFIDAEEFDKLLSALPDEETKEFALKWYRLDENSIPAAYVLQPVSTWIPEYFNEENESLRSEAQQDWRDQFTRLKDSLVKAAKLVFREGPEYHKYVQSVCEVEIDQGLMKDDNPARNCIWFHRQISGVHRNMSDHCAEVARYLDVSGGTEDYENPWDLQTKLKKRMVDVLPPKNMEEYNITWSNNGIDPKVEEHKKYLDQFCSDFQQKLQSMINDCIKEFRSAHINNPLYEEVVQHTLFCRKKVELFHGRKRTLEKIKDYIKSDLRKPLIIHGRSGSGKTSVVAMAARNVEQWLDGKGRVFLRFLGTTPKSSTLRRLLISVCQQIKFVYQVKARIPQKTKELVALFPTLLSFATSQHPIVVMFDALDQLNPDAGARQLAWLPRTLPQNVKFIVSTLPDQQFKYFTKLSALFRNPACFVAVPDLPPDDVSNILAKWLKAENRTLQAHQMQVLRDAFAQCPLPLFLKISFDEACRWRSYAAGEEMRLQPTVRTAIDFLFQQVERQHGEVLVRHALSYLTAAVSGLTSNELEDILSCDNHVLNDVFQYWTPPIRRLPPLLWVRIRTSLSSYLVDREANGVRVICWYHRQFIEAATDRYLSDYVQRKRFHSAIADYFLGKNSVGVNAVENALIGGKYVRLASIPNQPLKLSDTKYNLRKLHELPHHLIRSGRYAELKSEVLCNFHCLLSKIKAFSVRAVFDDFSEAFTATNDPDICAVSETLRLAQDAILFDPNQLASQIVGRLYQHEIENASALVKVNLSETLAELVRQASNPPEPALIPSRAFLSPPGGKLVETLVGHTSGVYGLAATKNGAFAVTGSSKGTVKVWDVTNGNVLHSVEDVGEGIGAVKCCHDDQLIVVSSKRGINILSFETGEALESLEVSYFDSAPPIALAGENETKVVLFSQKNLQVFNALSGKVLHKFITVKPIGQNCVLAALGDVVLCNSVDDENSLKVISASTYRVSHSIKIFDKTDDDQFLLVTQIAMKSTDEVLVAKKMKVDLYSVQSGEKLRSFQGKIDDWIKNMHLSPDEGFLIFPKDNKVAFLDLVTGERKDLLEHTDYTSRVVAVHNDLILTSAADNVARTWDLTREDVAQEAGKPETALRIYSLPNDARHVVTVGRLGIDNYAATVWDLSTCLPVRKVRNITSNYLEVINERRAALRVGNRLAIVNLDSWKVVTVIKGKLPPLQFASTDDVRVVSEGTELLTYSEDRKLLKIYNIETGDEVAELRPPRLEDEIRAFLVDPQGGVVVYICPKERGVLWDVAKRKLLFKANREKCYEKLTLSHAGFSPDGRYFVVSQRKTDEKDYIRHPVVWDVHKGQLAHDLRYDADTDTQSLSVIDNSRIISAHKDKNLVVWNLLHGTPTRILQTSHIDYRIDVIGSSGNLAFSYTEKTILVWDVEEGQQKASLTADKVTAVYPIGEGRCVAVGCESSMPLVLLTLQGEGVEPCRFLEEGTKAIAGTDVDICFEGVDKFFEEDEA